MSSKKNKNTPSLVESPDSNVNNESLDDLLNKRELLLYSLKELNKIIDHRLIDLGLN